MSILRVVESVMSRIRTFVRTTSVVGPPVRAGGSVIVPAVRVSFGFGVGGVKGRRAEVGGAGAGCGAKIEPVGCVAVTKGKARLLPLRSGRAAAVGIAELGPPLVGFVLRAAALNLWKRAGKKK